MAEPKTEIDRRLDRIEAAICKLVEAVPDPHMKFAIENILKGENLIEE